MKKVLLLASLLLVAVMVLGCLGCGGSNTNVTPSFLKYGTLQGKIMDATTGAAIGGDDLKMYLIQGTDNRQPNKLIKDINNDLVGEYAFNKIPLYLYNDYDDITFKVVVIKDGYQRFESTDLCLETDFSYGSYGDLCITNEVFNRIGNIYLYPLGESAGDVTVYVHSPQGRLVPNATVLLRQNVNNNSTISYTDNRLYATGGLNPSLTATTDSNGQATFSSAGLTLGGSYSIVVEPLTFEGQQLVQTTPTAAFTIGVNNTNRVVNMTAADNYSIFAISASNSVPGTIAADGALTITFNQPVTVDTTKFSATATHGTLAATPVTATLSSDGLTLTLGLNWTTGPATTDKGVTITYSYTSVVYLKSAQAAPTYTLFGGGNPVKNITTGNAVSGVVLMASH